MLGAWKLGVTNKPHSDVRIWPTRRWDLHEGLVRPARAKLPSSSHRGAAGMSGGRAASSPCPPLWEGGRLPRAPGSRSGWGQRMCPSNKFPGDDVGLRTAFGEPLMGSAVWVSLLEPPGNFWKCGAQTTPGTTEIRISVPEAQAQISYRFWWQKHTITMRLFTTKAPLTLSHWSQRQSREKGRKSFNSTREKSSQVISGSSWTWLGGLVF